MIVISLITVYYLYSYIYVACIIKIENLKFFYIFILVNF